MTSTAISAQGSTLQVGTGTGAAKTVTAVTAGYPTIITATAHGLVAGTVVTLAGITGAAGLLASFPIKNITANTFAVDFNSTGLTLAVSSGTATPAAYTKIANVKTFSGFDGEASEVDVTNLDSVAKEFILGLVDNGKFSIDIDSTGGNGSADPGLQALIAARVDGLIRNCKLTLPNAAIASFTAFIKTVPLSGGVDQSLKSTIGFRISGAVTWA